MREFNLEEAKKGHPVCTRDGVEARIICFDGNFNDDRRIVALIGGSNECIVTYTEKGKTVNRNTGYDLFMKTEKKSGYVNLHKLTPTLNDLTPMGSIYPTEKEAKANVSESFKESYCTTAKIEWEE